MEEYTGLNFGYTISLNDTDLCDDIRRDPGVLLVESNKPVWEAMDAIWSEDIEDDQPALEKRYTQSTAKDAPYGLQMISANHKLLTPVKNYGTYDHIANAGEGVNVYVLDSGIRISHELFEGRARNFGDQQPTDSSPYCRDKMDDKRGHGTQ